MKDGSSNGPGVPPRRRQRRVDGSGSLGMADTLLSSIPGISPSRQLSLKKGVCFPFYAVWLLYDHSFFTGGLVTISDVLFLPFSDVSQRCRLAPQVVQEIFDAISHASDRPPSILRDVVRDGSETITTGDVLLDKMLGGGIRVGMIWELVGEGRVFAYASLGFALNNAGNAAHPGRHSWHYSSHCSCSSPSLKAASTAQHAISPLPPVYRRPA
jgi:hypothetical protein